MQKFSLLQMFEQRSKALAGAKYPGVEDARYEDGMMFPFLRPGFRMSKGQRVMTMGSCFARNIERKLKGFDLPAARYTAPEGDPLAQRGNTVLNEYNPGSIAQRLALALGPMADPDAAIIPEGEGHCDHFITGQTPASLEVLRARRRTIEALYALIPTSDLLIITLGMTEAWFDRETGFYLNRAPGPADMRSRSPESRFELRILGVEDCLELLSPALTKALDSGLKNVMLTVSPVPLQRTFGTIDASMANSVSKATLRVVADILVRQDSRIDYFPSYEMVTLYSGNPFIEDNVHVRDEVVERVTGYMTSVYLA